MGPADAAAQQAARAIYNGVPELPRLLEVERPPL